MRLIRIVIDVSAYKDAILNYIGAIEYILTNEVKPLLKYHFKVLKIYRDDELLIVDIDADRSKMKLPDILSYCRDLCDTIIHNHAHYFASTSCYYIV